MKEKKETNRNQHVTPVQHRNYILLPCSSIVNETIGYMADITNHLLSSVDSHVLKLSFKRSDFKRNNFLEIIVFFFDQ